MACFIAPAIEAIAVTAAKKVVEKSEKATTENTSKNSLGKSFVKRLNWLSTMLWGGTALLAFEHMWHGEITPWFPFLTGAATPESTQVMLSEIATVGVAMAVLTSFVWSVMVIVSHKMESKDTKAEEC